jgi:hypothetical protein
MRPFRRPEKVDERPPPQPEPGTRFPTSRDAERRKRHADREARKRFGEEWCCSAEFAALFQEVEDAMWGELIEATPERDQEIVAGFIDRLERLRSEAARLTTPDQVEDTPAVPEIKLKEAAKVDLGSDAAPVLPQTPATRALVSLAAIGKKVEAVRSEGEVVLTAVLRDLGGYEFTSKAEMEQVIGGLASKKAALGLAFKIVEDAEHPDRVGKKVSLAVYKGVIRLKPSTGETAWTYETTMPHLEAMDETR